MVLRSLCDCLSFLSAFLVVTSLLGDSATTHFTRAHLAHKAKAIRAGQPPEALVRIGEDKEGKGLTQTR